MTRCGTPAGYTAHWRLGETPCDACKAASSAAGRRRHRQMALSPEATLIEKRWQSTEPTLIANNLPGDWKLWAACRGMDPNLFYPPSTSGGRGPLIDRPKEVCGSCPVQEECLEFAMSTFDQFGIWGGLTVEERKRLRSEGAA